MLCSCSKCGLTVLGHTFVTTRTRRRHELRDAGKAKSTPLSRQGRISVTLPENNPSFTSTNFGDKPDIATNDPADDHPNALCYDDWESPQDHDDSTLFQVHWDAGSRTPPTSPGTRLEEPDPGGPSSFNDDQTDFGPTGHNNGSMMRISRSIDDTLLPDDASDDTYADSLSTSAPNETIPAKLIVYSSWNVCQELLLPHCLRIASLPVSGASCRHMYASPSPSQCLTQNYFTALLIRPLLLTRL